MADSQTSDITVHAMRSFCPQHLVGTVTSRCRAGRGGPAAAWYVVHILYIFNILDIFGYMYIYIYIYVCICIFVFEDIHLDIFWYIFDVTFWCICCDDVHLINNCCELLFVATNNPAAITFLSEASMVPSAPDSRAPVRVGPDRHKQRNTHECN